MDDGTPAVAELTFHQVSVGDSFHVERTFTSEDVRQFASLSGDLSPLHVDPEYASTTEFGGCVVHGILLVSLFSQLIGMRIPGKRALYLGQDLSFRKPVLVGETVRAAIKVTGKNRTTSTIILATEIRNASDKVVVSGSAKVRVRDEDPGRSPEIGPAAVEAPAEATRVALITGASRGIGAEIAKTLAARGIAVAVNYFRSADAANALVRTIRDHGGTALSVQADVRHPDDVQRLVATVTRQLGALDLLVNGAIGELDLRSFSDLDWADFQHHLDYQVKAVMQVCQAAYPVMKAGGGGAVVNILSQVTSGQPPTRMADYVTAKYALYGLSKALAVEWAEDHIRVNMVSPGLTLTDLTQHFQERTFHLEAGRTPLKRIAHPTDVAKAVAFLLSEDAAFLTGINLSVSGGQVMT
jgi:3-oxoacyl-[acyl-carrier protein] reductase